MKNDLNHKTDASVPGYTSLHQQGQQPHYFPQSIRLVWGLKKGARGLWCGKLSSLL